MAKIQVFLIEDNRLLREGIATMLNEQGEFEVVAKSEDGDSIERLKNLNTPPQVVLLDLGLAKINSLNLMALLQRESPAIKVIAMDILPEYVDIVEFIKAGGSGFILKDATLDDYIDTIKAVVSGVQVLPPVLTNSLFTQIVERALKSNEGIPDSATELTQREREVVLLISEGLSNKGIAERLHISTFTVKSHVHNVLEKLTLNSRLEIAAFARGDEAT